MGAARQTPISPLHTQPHPTSGPEILPVPADAPHSAYASPAMPSLAHTAAPFQHQARASSLGEATGIHPPHEEGLTISPR